MRLVMVRCGLIGLCEVWSVAVRTDKVWYGSVWS